MARYIIFHNPISGAGRAARLVAQITAELAAHGHQVDDLETESKEAATRAAREVDASYDALVSVGGDGTHNSITNGLVDRPVPMLPVPAGIENLLSKALGVPADPEKIRRMLEAGRVRSFDVGLANETAFAVMSGVGFDAAVTGEVHAKRRGPIARYYYYWPTLRNLVTYKWPRLDVEVDGRQVASGAAMAVVANMQLYADGLRVCPQAVPDDGLLDVCVYQKPGGLQLVSYFLDTRRGKHLERPDVTCGAGRHIVVRAAEADVPFQVDGDAMGVAPVTYTIRPKALRMFVPAEGV